MVSRSSRCRSAMARSRSPWSDCCRPFSPSDCCHPPAIGWCARSREAEAVLTKPTRRGFLTAAAAGGAAGLPPIRQGQAAEAMATSEDACILTPQAEPGPYYIDPKLVRTDIRDGKAGVPLTLRIQVIEAGPCTPITAARVDIWHCDARGIYSAFPGQGDTHNLDTTNATFLRGTQMADKA